MEVVRVHEQWRRIREQAPAEARRFNDVPTRLLRAIDDFCEATGCEALRAAHFEEAQEDLVYFMIRGTLRRGIVTVEYDAAGDRSIHMTPALRQALGDDAAARLQRLYRRWVAAGPGCSTA